ncbi:hypothetical protein AC249_AIPGENE28307 [Exaiptasia diaphana]|nr:hypothetical protein AC249_AIPGENE28307 [Exaiptasia diaphana]
MATKEGISLMTIEDLQNELEVNGLSTSGTKRELVQRLQPNLLSILLRFRLTRIAMMSDIKKMFLQIKDQNCHRFIWRKSPTESPKVYCMTRVTFGIVSSPFQDIATVHHHCSINADKYPDASKEVQENMYVDDLLTGADDVDKAYTLHKELCSLMKNGGFELVKWYTNSKQLCDLIDPDLRGTAPLVQVKTKEEPLKSKGIQWDEPLDEGTKAEWKSWKEELKYLQALQVPRCPFAECDRVTKLELHGFCDASLKAYGAAM